MKGFMNCRTVQYREIDDDNEIYLFRKICSISYITREYIENRES